MLKILHARLQHYENQDLPDVQAGFRKCRGTRDQIASICWIIGKAREFQKNIYLCLTDYAKSYDCVDLSKLWKALKVKGIPDRHTCLLRNLYAGQEATIWALYGTTDWFKIEKGVWQGYLLSPCLFNLYAEHILRNARLDELQVGIKIGWEKHQQLQICGFYHTTGRKQEALKSLLMRVKEQSETAGLKLNTKKLSSWHLSPLLQGK